MKTIWEKKYDIKMRGPSLVGNAPVSLDEAMGRIDEFLRHYDIDKLVRLVQIYGVRTVQTHYTFQFTKDRSIFFCIIYNPTFQYEPVYNVILTRENNLVDVELDIAMKDYSLEEFLQYNINNK